MNKFDRILVFQNIKYLIAQAGDKIGDVEKAAGVSQGYLSRLAKTDESISMPIMDLLLWSAEKYRISVDTLLNINLQGMTPNELLLRKMLEKMIHDTQANLLSWTMEAKNLLENFHEQFEHPLMNYFMTDFGKDIYSYHSEFNPENNIGDFSTYANMGDQLVYIIQVEHGAYGETKKKGFEIYFSDLNKSNVEKLVCLWPEHPLFTLVGKCFDEAIRSSRQIRMTPHVRTLIENYLKPAEPDDDLPF